VVHTGVALLCYGCQRCEKIFKLRADELRSGPKRISVLLQMTGILSNGDFFFVNYSKLAALQKVPEDFGTFDLTRMWPCD
jgi:hypothetical protein